MNWRKMAWATAAIAWLGLSATPARAGLETFANYTNASSSYTTNTFAGQDGSTWTVAACRGDIAVNGKAPTIRNVVNAYIRSGTITGGVGSLTFKYRKPFTGTTMSNKVLVVGAAGAYTNYVAQVPSTTNEVLVFTAAVVNIEGNFTVVITNTASSARISVDDIEWTPYSAGGGEAPAFGANPGPLGATTEVAMAFTVSATGSPAPTLALQSQTASAGYSFAAGTGVLSYTPPAGDLGAQTFTFTASNSVGVATQIVGVAVTNAPAIAPEFGANPGPVSATATVATAFTVSATGVPTPALSLEGATASAGYSFAAGTGQLSYTPPAEDVGGQTFTFAASNGAGVALQTVSVTVASAPVNVPAVSVTNIGTNSFTVNWTACTGASNYQVQVATDNLFTGGGSGSNAPIASVGNAGVSNGWAYVNGASNAGTYHKLVATTAPGVVSPEFSTLAHVAVTAGYSVATFGGASANELLLSYSLDGGTNWVVFGTNTDATSSTYVTGRLQALPSAALGQASVRIKWHCDVATAAMGLRLQSLTIAGVQAAGGSLLADRTLAALTTDMTGLDLETTYYIRARKQGGEWSDIVSATTASSAPMAPAFGANPGPLGATTEVAMAFTVSATGNPAPTLALQSQTASAGYSFAAGTGVLSYTPPAGDLGAQTFTFTASNSVGVATQIVGVAVTNAPATAPEFGANPGPLGATTGVARVFTVSATGVPTPALSLASATASAGYSFAAETGQLSYTPPPEDAGGQTFTFAASNSAGVALQTVSVTVASAPVNIPAVSVANIDVDSFTVNWTACTGASNYQVQVATDTNFTGGGSGSNAPIASVGNAGASNGWAYVNGASNAGTYHKLVATTAPGVVSPEFSTLGCSSVTAGYAVATFGGSTANELLLSYSLDGGSNWVVFGTNTGATNSTYVTGQTQTLPAAALGQASVRIKWHCDVATAALGLRLQDLVVSGTQIAGGGSLVADATVAALTYAASGLDLETTYYVRARKEGGEWSGVVSATTASPVPTAPVFGANPGPLGATTGVARTFAVTALGSPAPTLALQGTTASTGYVFAAETGVLTYTAPEADAGARTFTFTAGNASGVATQVVEVAVSLPPAAVPVFAANPGPIGATVEVATAFTVAATGYPSPALSLADTTASAGYSFAAGTGQLSYTPPAGDVGAQTFTFAASNSAGVALQTVSVAVVSAPTSIPTVTVTNIGTNSFTVNWTEVTDTLDYQIQVATDTNFTASVSGSNATLAATVNSGLSSGWAYVNGASNSGTYHKLVAATAPGVVSAEFSTMGYAAAAAGYSVATYGGAGANVLRISYSLDGGSNWVVFATNASAVSSTYVTGLQNALPPAALGQAGVRLKWHCDAATALAGLRLQDLAVSGTQESVGGSILADEVVAALTYGATGLDMETTYHVRVRGVDGIWSDIVLATTAGPEPKAPWFTAGMGPHSTTAGMAVVFTVAALGTPAPVLALQSSSTWSGNYSFTPSVGYFLYRPPTNDAGEQTFTFTASNSMGVATQVVVVSVAPAVAPSFVALGTQSATTGVAIAFSVTANGAPPPVVELRSSTASSGYSFLPDIGSLIYTPPPADAGKTNTFTFTASNLLGIATQTVGVAVSRSPPRIDSMPPQYIVINHALDLAVTATDPDSSNLTFFCTSAVASATWTFNTYDGAFSFTPTTNQIGTNIFVFTATDDTYLESAPSNLVVMVNASTDQVAVAFGKARVVGEEGVATVTIPVNLAYSGSATVQVRFSGPTNGTAQRGADFNCATTLVVSGTSGSLVVDIVDDNLAEGPESILMTLVPVSPATAGALTQAVFQIRDNDAFSVMAANITSGSAQGYESPGERIFEALCPDVVLLQEFNVTNATYRSWVDQHFGTNFNYFVESGAQIPNGIVSRFPITASDEWDDPKVSNRDFAWATIDLPGDKDLHVVSVHLLTTSSSIRAEEAAELVGLIQEQEWLPNSYLVIGGDFNIASRGESAISTLGAVVTDSKQPADQDNESNSKNTNSGRTSPYDLVLPSTNLNARHHSFALWGYAFANGMVFDTRPAYVTWSGGLPPPALATDSAAAQMQHMAVVKVFELEKNATALDPPQAFAATPVSQSRIDLAFTTNAAGSDVLVVGNDHGNFDDPVGSVPGVGLDFAGGTVIYQGVVSPRSHTGLTSCATHYYKCWSVSGTNYSASGLTAAAATMGPETPVSVRAGATGETSFAAIWDAVADASAYRLDVSTGPSFSGAGGAWSTVFRETMGVSSGTTALVEHEAANGFDNDIFAMTDGGATGTAEIRTTSPSSGYVDPAGYAASSNANVYFSTTASGNPGFAIAGIDARGYDELRLSFGYRKETAASNMAFNVQWSTNDGAAWNALAVSGLPATNAAMGWYMVSNLTLAAGAVGADNLSLRWEKTGGAAGRVDDILLQGYSGGAAAFVPGFSNRTVSGTGETVTGLTAAATYYFRVAAISACTGAFSSVASATTLESQVPPAFGTAPGPFSTTVGVAVVFSVSVAQGNPEPVLALQGATAATGYVFAAETGQLTYTPTLDDIGTQTFTFAASNATGTATQTVVVVVSDLPAAAPVFGANPGPLVATTSVARTFAVTASGYPVPALALQSATASGGYGFTPGTGELAYAPPEADVGARTFTFTASNGTGVATQTVSVSVAAGIPSAPAAIWASATNIVDFTASWSASPLATGYRLEASTSATFQIGIGASVQSTLASNAATAAALITNGWSGVDLGGATYVAMTQTSSTVVSPAFSTVGFTNLTVDFRGRTFGGTTKSNIAVAVSTNDGADWTPLGLVNPSQGSTWASLPTLTDTANLGHGQTRIRWQTPDAGAGVGVGISNLIVKGWSAGTAPAHVPGYSNRVVAGTSQSVTGLTADTVYYFRVRAENAAGTGAHSGTAGATTRAKANQTIDFPAIGDQLATNAVALAATASSGLGVSFAVVSGPASITNGTTLTFSGAGTVVVAASQAGDDIWNAAPGATNVFNVAKAPALVTLDDLAQSYDGTARIATATTEPAGLAVVFTYDGHAWAPTNAGSYAVTGAVNEANYEGSASGVLVVSPSAQAISFPAIGDQLATNAVALAATASSGLDVSFAVVSGPASITNGTTLTFSGAGTVVVAASQAGDGNWNAAPGATNVFNVAKAAAIVTLGDLAQSYDGTARLATATTEPAGLAVVFTYDGLAWAPTNAGSYAVTGTVNEALYQGSAAGVLVVSQAPESAAVTLENLAQTYDGTPRIVTASTDPEGLDVEITYDGSPLAPTNAGSYAVTGTVNDVNFAGSATGTLVVAKAAATVALSGLEHVYDGSPKSATATTTPEGLAVAITYDGAAEPPSATGSYAVVAAILEANYVGSTNGTLVIAAALTPFESWLQGRALDPEDVRFAQGADDDRDGRTTWEEYVADTDPAASTSVLALSGAYVIGTKTTNGTGQIRMAFPASSNRFYRLEYCTRLTNAATVGAIDLGRGVPGMVITNGATGTWYGVIRVRVDP